MPSAPSSPERHLAEPDDLPRRSSDESGRCASTGQASESSPATERAKKQRSQGRSAMAAMMSGLESRLLPKSLTRGRTSNRESSQRNSSVDFLSPAIEAASKKLQKMTIGGKTDHMWGPSMNESDEAFAQPSSSSSLPGYVKPTRAEQGERLAKDVFDSEHNIIHSSDDSDSDGDDDIWNEDIQSTATPNDIKGKQPRKSALKSVIRPQAFFDNPAPAPRSAAGTPYGSDDEAELEEIHRAQRLAIYVSLIDNSVPNRSICTIIRGNFESLQAEADEGRRRQRKYLVATDLSDESVVALESTIGTLLRDGDTMWALYAIQEDASSSSTHVAESAHSNQDINTIVGNQTQEATNPGRNYFSLLGSAIVKSASAEGHTVSATEAERVKAVKTVTETCLKLLRKTSLQVRIAVEVIHCKNPKHLVTEAIDYVGPTVTVVGARGQSALKGVLLGSFSNYLMANSSAQVMVAQLPKRSSKNGPNREYRYPNYLRKPKSLTQARVD
ncbi:uncharacterized protein N7483_008446 [Penicillium malachiteum]|uniref:uncharacterized protein n=1 Tax=Penicillium malachiteum TaxID=1324776 RepID=UPI0025484738|nr:uncharacterized protein N7483_008446 [Penicillium malachiteum]KAJ5720512.1 hypothetical protein N7483_008446 [Penicillium malachiteum]